MYIIGDTLNPLGYRPYDAWLTNRPGLSGPSAKVRGVRLKVSVEPGLAGDAPPNFATFDRSRDWSVIRPLWGTKDAYSAPVPRIYVPPEVARNLSGLGAMPMINGTFRPFSYRPPVYGVASPPASFVRMGAPTNGGIQPIAIRVPFPPTPPRPTPPVVTPGGVVLSSPQTGSTTPTPVVPIDATAAAPVTASLIPAGFADWLNADSFGLGIANKWVGLGVIGAFLVFRRGGDSRR